MTARKLAILLAPLTIILALTVALPFASCGANAAKKHGAMTIAPDERRFTVNLSVQTRGGALYVPRSLPKSGTGLVIALHGMGSTGEAFRARGFDMFAERHGFIVVYPDGLSGGWSSPDDTAFFGYIIDGIRKRYRIDERAVFMTGHSLGAVQCHESAVLLEGRVRAIAPVSGPMCADTAALTVRLGPQHQQHEAKPVSVLFIHSLDDDVIPYDGKIIGNIYSVKHTLEFWNTVNGCSDTWTEYPAGQGFDGRIWRGPEATCVVATRFQGGHGWPPTATEMITKFFLGLF